MRYLLSALLLVMTLDSEAIAANYALEIIQPRAGLTTTNRFYKAYPAIEYNVRMAVIGGSYPFVYSLDTAPSGMAINQTTGTITWANPVTGGSPHTVTARVVDQEGTAATVTWTVTVTTSGFLFVDAVNGIHAAGYGCSTSCGTGTLANPFKSMIDWYEGSDAAAKTRTAYQGAFVYYKNGTYTLDAFLEAGLGGGRMPLVSYYKPMVHIAYPGHSPVWDFRNAPSIIWYSGLNNLYLDGLEIKNMSYYGIQVEASGDNITLRRLVMHDLNSPSGVSENQSFIRFLVGSQTIDYMSIQDSTFYNLNHGAAVRTYETNKLLIEDNTVYNIADSFGGGLEGFAIKQNNLRTTIRHNVIHDVAINGINGNNNDVNGGSGGYEYLFNLIYNCSNAITLNQNDDARNFFVYRNTLLGSVKVLNSTGTTGPFNFSNNVIVNNNSVVDHITCGGGFVGCVDPSRVVRSNNLSGIAADGIVDASGNLQGSFRTQYLGIMGYELGASGTTPPARPTGVIVR